MLVLKHLPHGLGGYRIKMRKLFLIVINNRLNRRKTSGLERPFKFEFEFKGSLDVDNQCFKIEQLPVGTLD